MAVSVTLASPTVVTTLGESGAVSTAIENATIEVTNGGADVVVSQMQGLPGASAYDVAVALGFTGDVYAWLANFVPIAGFKYSVSGNTQASERFATTSDFGFTVSAANSGARAVIAATVTTVFTIKRNGSVTVGTMTFAPGATTASVSISAPSISVGDLITIEAPTIPDSTLADIVFSIRS